MNNFDLFFSFEDKVCPSTPNLPLANISANLLNAGTETLEFPEDPEEIKRMSKMYKQKRIQKRKESQIIRKKNNSIKSLSQLLIPNNSFSCLSTKANSEIDSSSSLEFKHSSDNGDESCLF